MNGLGGGPGGARGLGSDLRRISHVDALRRASLISLTFGQDFGEGTDMNFGLAGFQPLKGEMLGEGESSEHAGNNSSNLNGLSQFGSYSAQFMQLQQQHLNLLNNQFGSGTSMFSLDLQNLAAPNMEGSLSDFYNLSNAFITPSTMGHIRSEPPEAPAPVAGGPRKRKGTIDHSLVSPSNAHVRGALSAPEKDANKVKTLDGFNLNGGIIEKVKALPKLNLNGGINPIKPEAGKAAKKDKSGVKKEEKEKRARLQSSQYRGVSRCHKDGRWQARIRVGAVVKYLGRFKVEEDAARCYDIAAAKLHGGRAQFNFAAPDAAVVEASTLKI